MKSDWKLSRPLTPEQREYLRQQNVDDVFRAEVTRCHGSMEAFLACSLFRQDGFRAISNMVELSWRQILGDAGHDLRLKPSQMGRSKHPPIKKQHHQMSSSIGRVGDYSATCEATSVHSKQVVRQCRRLQCVIRMLTKFQDDHMPDVQYQTMWIDQECIISAKGFGVSYLEWAERKGLPALNLPVFDLHSVQLHFIAVQTFADESAKRQNSDKNKAWKDLLAKSFSHQGGRLAFRHVKNSFVPEISHVHVKKALGLAPVRQKMKGPLRYRLKTPIPQGSMVHSDVGPVRLNEAGDFFTITTKDDNTPSKFWTEGWAFDPVDVHKEFFSFWDKFWNEPQTPHADEPYGLNLLSAFPDALDSEIQVADLHSVIKCTKANTSVGSDAWSLNDFKMIPEVALDTMVKAWNLIFSDQIYIPATFSMARVLLLAKHLDAESISDTRPITICPLTYRLCVRAMTKKITRQLLGYYPVGVLGGLPKRASWECYYKAQFVIENAQMTSSQLCGLTTDVVKMFNAVRRPAAAALLERAGVPAANIKVWIAHLDSMRRYLRVQKSLSAGHTSVVPEGDALSVLVATLFGVVWCEAIRAQEGGTAVPTAYVDNLDVVAKTGQDLEHAVDVMSNITATWGLAFDLKKSWCWDVGFDKSARPSLRIERKPCGKNLGASMTYNKHPLNSIQVRRIQGVYNRITRLGPVQMTDEQKCRLIKTGIWPAALYGAEITYLGKQWYVTLRDLAVKSQQAGQAAYVAVHGAVHCTALTVHIGDDRQTRGASGNDPIREEVLRRLCHKKVALHGLSDWSVPQDFLVLAAAQITGERSQEALPAALGMEYLAAAGRGLPTVAATVRSQWSF